MEKVVNISSEVYNDVDFKNNKHLKEIDNLDNLDINSLSWVIIDKYKNDVYVLKQNWKELWYVKWKEKLKSILRKLEKKNNIKIKTW